MARNDPRNEFDFLVARLFCEVRQQGLECLEGVGPILLVSLRSAPLSFIGLTQTIPIATSAHAADGRIFKHRAFQHVLQADHDRAEVLAVGRNPEVCPAVRPVLSRHGVLPFGCASESGVATECEAEHPGSHSH